jgi:SAM-dependent methyltransferase
MKVVRSISSWLKGSIPYRIVHRDSLEGGDVDLTKFDVLPKGEYDYVPKGTYIHGPADRFLLVPKNRYRVVLLPDQERRSDVGVGWLTEDNTPESYDLLWGDEEALKQFREEGDGIREKLTKEIVDHIADRISDDAHVVDIGCGAGDLLIQIQSRQPGVRLAGCDFSPGAIERARQRLAESDLCEHKIKTDLPYKDGLFDVVLCTDTLEHLEYPALIVNELVRICRPGGVVVIVVPDGDVDQFLGHLWFWSEDRLREFLGPWNGVVQRLPETRELLAIIEMSVTEVS